MNFSVPSFETRRAQIKTVTDITKQIELAKAHAARIRNAAKKATTLAEKVTLLELSKQAEAVLRTLRSKCFDIEDELAVLS